MILALRVLKNSEEVFDKDEPNFKLDAYTKSLKNSISFAILHKAIFELYLLNKDKLPKLKAQEIIMMDRFLPLLHQLLLFDNIGTQKLSSVIREKIINDKTADISEFEKFLSVFLYSDIRGREYDKIILEFIKNVKKHFIEDMSFFKLVTYYFYRSKDDEMDLFYLNLIADLFVKSKGYSKKRKSEIINDYKKKKTDKDQL